MKRLVICVLSLLLVLVLALSVAASDVEGVPEDEQESARPAWQVYVEDKLAPTVASVLASVLSVYIMALPVLSGVRRASDLFGGAAADAKSVSASGEDIKRAVGTLIAQYTAMSEEQAHTKELLKKVLSAVAIACSASGELVKNGMARELMKAVEEYE